MVQRTVTLLLEDTLRSLLLLALLALGLAESPPRPSTLMATLFHCEKGAEHALEPLLRQLLKFSHAVPSLEHGGQGWDSGDLKSLSAPLQARSALSRWLTGRAAIGPNLLNLQGDAFGACLALPTAL